MDEWADVTERSCAGAAGSVMGGRTACSREVEKASLTRDVMSDVFPVPSSPQMHIRTGTHQFRTTNELWMEFTSRHSATGLPLYSFAYDRLHH